MAFSEQLLEAWAVGSFADHQMELGIESPVLDRDTAKLCETGEHALEVGYLAGSRADGGQLGNADLDYFSLIKDFSERRVPGGEHVLYLGDREGIGSGHDEGAPAPTPAGVKCPLIA